MLTTAYSTGLFGIDGYIVTVECSFSENLPYFEIVGLPDNAVRESKRRLAAASENSGFGTKSRINTKNLSKKQKIFTISLYQTKK